MARTDKRGPRPHQWISGPDETRHEQYRVYSQQKNQAQWRGEGWDIEFDDWVELWGGNWDQRGKRREHYCMTRNDPSQPWKLGNAVVVSRLEFLQRQRMIGKPRRKPKADT